VRKAWRKLKTGAAAQWDRLSLLMRVALGLAVSLCMAYGVIHYKVKPCQNKRASLESSLQSRQVPAFVPALEGDNELQETEIKIEAVSATMERHEEMARAAVQDAAVPRDRDEGPVVGAFDALIFENALDVRNRKHLSRQPVAGPLSASQYQYVAAGPFPAIEGFLRSLARFGKPCRLDAVAIEEVDDPKEGTAAAAARSDHARPGQRGRLGLRFVVTFYFLRGVDR
jgi:hypothetical protein